VHTSPSACKTGIATVKQEINAALTIEMNLINGSASSGTTKL